MYWATVYHSAPLPVVRDSGDERAPRPVSSMEVAGIPSGECGCLIFLGMWLTSGVHISSNESAARITYYLWSSADFISLYYLVVGAEIVQSVDKSIEPGLISHTKLPKLTLFKSTFYP